MLKNKEILIQLIMRLRGRGITNDKLLNIIEKNPPHYYASLFGGFDNNNELNYNELVNISRIFDNILKRQLKINNFLICNIKIGWSIVLASQISRRVYSLCYSSEQKIKLENLYNHYNLKNVYLACGKSWSTWKKVAPFEIVFSLSPIEKISDDLLKYISKTGIIITPYNKNKKTKYVSIDARKHVNDINIDYNSLKESEIL